MRQGRRAPAQKVVYTVENIPHPTASLVLPTTGQVPLPPIRLSTAQAAEYTGLAESTLRYYRHAGTGPASYTVGSKVFYDVSDLADWLAAQKAATLRGGVK
jgi:hypothetical protein